MSINLYSTHTKRSDTKYTICVTIIIYDKNKNGFINSNKQLTSNKLNNCGLW